ncbi:tautomerase family protein [Allopusillimonas ginsengisoli]|uniref:tautomerase family protein n=1 Tax=Allopusillimonas ginsengisoli TaxID=453575 RepID=UPI00101F4D95|nr:4-oxalocrotonate tautomerase family protein [Allopusillimonas ginsengisoli]
MPLAHIYLGKGRTYEEKEKVIEAVTLALVNTLGSKPDSTWVVINEVPRSEWGIGGKPIARPD